MELATQLNPNVSATSLEFYATKLVLDVMDYCHRDDFPEALCYACAGALAKQFMSTDETSIGTGGAPLKALTQDDTKFEFAVAEKDTSQDEAGAAFNVLKPRLNIYRKVVSL